MTDLQTLLSEASAGSRELDALIAIHFGKEHGPHEHVCIETRSIYQYPEIAAPCSTSIDAALALINEIAKPIRVSFHEHIGGASVEIVLDAAREFSGNSLATVPLAACLALLAATEAQDG